MSSAVIKVLQVILAVVIIGLGYLLYISITEPYKVIERQNRLTELTRERMEHIRTALTRYKLLNERYPHTLDSLVTFVQEDSLLNAARDSVFPGEFNLDSLAYSPRTGKRFEYAVNDTSRIQIYYLKDPDTDDEIGSLSPDITMVNAASWE